MRGEGGGGRVGPPTLPLLDVGTMGGGGGGTQPSSVNRENNNNFIRREENTFLHYTIHTFIIEDDHILLSYLQYILIFV